MNQPIVCIGELLIDFFSVEQNVDLIHSQTFTKKAGGAPANVCATIGKLGGAAHFCGKVGNDSFGDFLQNTLTQFNVNTTYLLKDKTHPTTLAFVSLQEDGQRDFIFNRGADAFLSIGDVPADIFDTSKLIHFGSATALLPSPLYETYTILLKRAKDKNCFASFDPNFRSDLWKGQEDKFIAIARECIAQCDFLKVSEEELFLLTDNTEMNKAVSELHSLGAICIAVTLGKNGTFLSYKGESALIPSIPIQAIDTTGAGDAFVGATLYQLGKLEAPHSISFSKWQEIVKFSNIVAAKVCEKIGAIEAIPNLEEIQSL